MTLSTAGYVVGANQPLTCARILWAQMLGTVSGGGTNPAFADNEYTNQRWVCGALPASWTLLTAADAPIDTIILAAHRLAGCTVLIETSSTIGGAFVTRATIVPTDNSTIAVMFNNAGAPHVIRRYRITVSGAPTVAEIGIIRGGVALQMAQPVFGGVRPIGLNRMVETRHSISETGQWLGRTIQRQASMTVMDWTHLTAAWYRANFQPFALSLPQTPFGLIQNPARMPESVAWCWTDTSPAPENMGVIDYMQVSLPITGFLE